MIDVECLEESVIIQQEIYRVCPKRGHIYWKPISIEYPLYRCLKCNNEIITYDMDIEVVEEDVLPNKKQ